MVTVGGSVLLLPSIMLLSQLSTTSAFEVKGSCKSQVKAHDFMDSKNKKIKKIDQIGGKVSLYCSIPPEGDMLPVAKRDNTRYFNYL